MAVTRAIARRPRGRALAVALVLALALALARQRASFASSMMTRTSDDGSFVDDRGTRVRAPPSPTSVVSNALEHLRARTGAGEGGGVDVDEDATRAARAAAARAGKRRRGIEFACGNCALELDARGKYSLMGVIPRADRATEDGKRALAAGAAVAAPLRAVPFKRARFDYVVMLETFEKINARVSGEIVDPVINEATRVAKKGAIMVFAKRAGSDRARGWWMDTFCAHGWAEDTKLYSKIVPIAVRRRGNVFVLRRLKRVKMEKCRCSPPEGTDAKDYCGAPGRPNAQSEVREYWRSIKRPRSFG